MIEAEIKIYIEKCKNGDKQAFRIIVEKTQQMVYSLSFRMLCNHEDAKDIVQETFIKVWYNFESFNSGLSFKTWLLTIASRLCLDKIKSNKRKNYTQNIDLQDIINLVTDDPEKNLINSEMAIIITKITELLSPKQKLVFTLRELEGFEINEIVEITGLSPEKIKSNLYLARQSIKAVLIKI